MKKILPHIIAIVVFLIVSIIFCKPVLEGNVLNQHDNVGWKGMAQNSFEYKDKNGHFPLWNPNLFSGMPNYQVAMEGKTVLPDLTKIFSFGLPKPINFFFLACLCFYILCLTLRIRPVIGILSGLGFAFASYNPVIVAAGHDTQMLATAFIPLLIAGLISIFEKKYWLGLALTTYATYQQIGVNHLQVTYYTFLIAIAVTLCYVYVWVKNKEWKHLGIAAGITIISAIIGIAGNALTLKTTSEYAKYTMRGGKDINIQGDSVTVAKTSGLDTSYAFEYSLGKAETVTFMMPNAFGGSSSKPAGENSKVVSKLMEKGVDENNAIQFASQLPGYWGKLSTSGPAYLGVIICLLGLIGFVVVKKPLRWGLLAITIFGIFMAWGKYFAGFNVFLFENMPLYNKFRAPSFSQVIPQFAVGVIAALSLQYLLFEEKAKEVLNKDFKKILYAVGGLFAFLGLMYFSMDYSSISDPELMASIATQTKSDEIARAVIAGLKADRNSMFGGQLLRAVGFAVLLLAIFYAYIRSWLKPLTAAIIILVISTLELTITSHDYLNEDNYVAADDYSNINFAQTPVDQQILQDKDPNFRVFNLAGDRYNESRTTYYHKSIGGYHPAKLRIYQDLLEMYLYGNPNQGILNMLNAKYVIIQDPQTGQRNVMPNPNAFGPCWLVKNIKVVDDRVASIKTIGKTNLRDTAIIEKSVAANLVQPQWDSTASIKMINYDNDAIEYEVNGNGPQFAVFSEIYYPVGWNAYIDGKKTEYYNVNYVLRGLSVPAGKHTVKFIFEPASVKSGTSIMFISSIIILLVFVGGLFMAWRQSRKKS
ncbi:MAG TPA: YfhO family protein [Chitinophagaceae bacterium]|nr:YfhO family protein [Chitinophagaceae bacterium]